MGILLGAGTEVLQGVPTQDCENARELYRGPRQGLTTGGGMHALQQCG